eukprot:m.285777 g.285777  ORF g.285777 m.285777 type:complete len:283 (+) comp17774_c0_seq40:1920-2768(+)
MHPWLQIQSCMLVMMGIITVASFEGFVTGVLVQDQELVFDCNTNYTLLDEKYFGKGGSKVVWRAKTKDGQEFVLKLPSTVTHGGLGQFLHNAIREKHAIDLIRNHSKFPDVLMRHYGVCNDTRAAAVEAHLAGLPFVYEQPLPACYGIMLLQQLLRLNKDLDTLGLIQCDPAANQLAIGPDLKLRIVDLDSFERVHQNASCRYCSHRYGCLQIHKGLTTDNRCDENQNCLGFDGQSALQASFVTTANLLFGTNMSNVTNPVLRGKLQQLYRDATRIDRAERY